MIVVSVVRNIRDDKGNITGYIIQDEYGKQAGIYKDNLKENIRNGLCTVTNLKLTSDGRLITKQQAKVHKEEKPTLIINENNKTAANTAPSICGVQIKNIKTGHGREGEYYYGTVYYNGKKLGNWGQDPNGCISDNYEFNENILKEALNKYRIKVCNPNISLEALMSNVVVLSEYYKSYTKMIKQGKYTKLTIVTDEYDFQYVEIKHNGMNAAISNSIDIASHKIAKNGMGVVIKHFNNEKDFIIGD